MNQAKLKAYAPQARREFIQAVTDRAAFYGLHQDGISVIAVPMLERGDGVVIEGKVFPRKVAEQRKALEDRVRNHGFAQTIDAVAYTWFNRLVAIRYMEIHGYLEHGYRMLSHREGQARPEILDHAADVDFPGLDRQKAIELKLDGTKDEALYRLLLLAQCNALHRAMPFLFEEIGDETELLLPANLLNTDSLVRKLVESTDESEWGQIEIIGWLYQYYISEKKEQVIGKVVKSEDIPAATQLFTPNWIVKYMVQNSLGAQWLATYPHSPLKAHMEYYIEPAEQREEVRAQLEATTPSARDPERLTLIDPASGSGHVLVEAYDLFKAIYRERGYRQQETAQLILEKNLFGLDIDERAAQLTGFALMMKGRADDRRLFERSLKLNVMSLVDSNEFDAERLASGLALEEYGLRLDDLLALKRLFEHATTFGSLIQVPEDIVSKLPALKRLSKTTGQDLFVSDALNRLGPLVQQAELLGSQYDVVVANPPYMGGNAMNPLVKRFAKSEYEDARADLFACFIERSYSLSKPAACNAMVTMQSWMFLSSFESVRKRMLTEHTLTSMVHIGFNSFPSLNSKIALATAFSTRMPLLRGFVGTFVDLNSAPQSADKNELFLAHDPANRFETSAEELARIPGMPVAYWASSAVRAAFETLPSLKGVAETCQGLSTADNARFVRLWSEVDSRRAALWHAGQSSKFKWYPFDKGGGVRKWFGNNESVLNWEHDGSELKALQPKSVIRNEEYYFRPGVTWGKIGIIFSARLTRTGHIFSDAGMKAFTSTESDLATLLGFLCSKVSRHCLGFISQTLNFEKGNVDRLPLATVATSHIERLVALGEADWDSYERSWNFRCPPILPTSCDSTLTLESSYATWVRQNRDTIAEMKRLEDENNRLFIEAYGLGGELTRDVSIGEITITTNPAYRYGDEVAESDQWNRFREDTMKELISYGIGCMMGRYSLDAPGLIYARSGNEGFDPSCYTRFPADEDGIVPLTDTDRFADDGCNRIIEFVSVAWDAAHLEANLSFLTQSLSPKRNESSRETLRRYLCDGFFKDHLQTYKKRPIYWLFSSGKQKAFQCLVYLHRYNEGTLSRMRTEYVVPLQGQIASRIERLEGDKAKATSTSHRKKLEKEQDLLKKQETELLAFEEKLRHAANKKIRLDLDDGVKVNYGKFGDLLAAVDAVAGSEDE